MFRKTTILNDIKLILNQISQLPQEVLPTIGQNICKGVFNGVTFTFRDAAGIQKFRKYWDDSFKDTDVVVFVVDCSNHTRLHESTEEFRKVVHCPQLTYAPIVIFAHKQDLQPVASDEDVKEVVKWLCCFCTYLPLYSSCSAVHLLIINGLYFHLLVLGQ
jgi:small GTP-binding protein